MASKLADRAAQKGKAFRRSEKLGNTEDPNGDQSFGCWNASVVDKVGDRSYTMGVGSEQDGWFIMVRSGTPHRELGPFGCYEKGANHWLTSEALRKPPDNFV